MTNDLNPIDFIYSSHDVNTDSIGMWVILLSNADWDCFKTLTSRKILKIRNPLLEEHCAFLEVIHLFQEVGRVRNKLLVSHSSTESEIISLDTGLRLDGLPALELWDLIVSVLHGNISQCDQIDRGNLCTNLREVRAVPQTLQKSHIKISLQ